MLTWLIFVPRVLKFIVGSILEDEQHHARSGINLFCASQQPSRVVKQGYQKYLIITTHYRPWVHITTISIRDADATSLAQL
jgi:hypothetical protein